MDHKPKAIEPEMVDLKRLKDLSADLPGLMEYAHSVGGFSITPTEQGKIKDKALMAMQQQTQMQLDMLYEQVRLLASQIQTVKDRALASELIYQAKMNFEPIVGMTYYLYLKGNEKILSMIAPNEWGASGDKYEYVATAELLADHTWKLLDKA